MVHHIVPVPAEADRGIFGAFARALFAACSKRSERNPERSQDWVSALCDELEAHARAQELPTSDSVRGFCRCNSGNRSDFGLNELLFDILIARVQNVAAAHSKTQLVAIRRALWAVESEFKRDNSRDVLVDLNKLVVADADNKLLVISDGPVMLEWACETMSRLLDPVRSAVYLAAVTHPSEWGTTKPATVELFRLTADGVWHHYVPAFSCEVPAASESKASSCPASVGSHAIP